LCKRRFFSTHFHVLKYSENAVEKLAVLKQPSFPQRFPQIGGTSGAPEFAGKMKTIS
jgi:hypothetical protein